MNIKYYKRNIYGIDKKYVLDKDQAAIIQDITGQKTLTDRIMAAFERLGFTFKEELQKNERSL